MPKTRQTSSAMVVAAMLLVHFEVHFVQGGVLVTVCQANIDQTRTANKELVARFSYIYIHLWCLRSLRTCLKHRLFIIEYLITSDIIEPQGKVSIAIKHAFPT